MQITAKELYELLFSLDINNYPQEGLNFHLKQDDYKSIIMVEHLIPSLGFKVRYEVSKETQAKRHYALANKQEVFIEGVVYEYEEQSMSVKHLPVMEAYRNIVLATKRGDFVIDWDGKLLNGMWQDDCLKDGNVMIHIVNGSIKQLCDNRRHCKTTEGVYVSGAKSMAKTYSVGGYSPFAVYEDYIIDYLKLLNCIERLKINDYLNKHI